MAHWKLRIEGVPDILERYPEEAGEEATAKALRDCIRPQLEAHDAHGSRGTPLHLSRFEKEEGLRRLDELPRAGVLGEDFFNVVWSHFYDWADDCLVWIEPLPTAGRKTHA